jgi:hypothetical protein
VTVALALLVAGAVGPLVARAWSRRWALRASVGLLVVALVHDVWPVLDLWPLAEALARADVLGVAGGDGLRLLLLVAALLWCGPAADLLVRRVLQATGLPAPEAAAAAGLRAGRWIGRLERWLLVACIAAGEPALAVIPIGGKALFRYAEVVADARADQPRLARPSGDDGPGLPRDALVDYVIVGSLASWAQAIALGLVVAAS